MDELEKTMPEDLWRKAFEEAAETPPSRVWDAIEHRLNESDSTRIVPLWGTGLSTSRPIVWGMGVAASVALVLAGWWLLHRSPLKSSSTVAHVSAVSASNAGHHSVSMKATSAQPHPPD